MRGARPRPRPKRTSNNDYQLPSARSLIRLKTSVGYIGQRQPGASPRCRRNASQRRAPQRALEQAWALGQRFQGLLSCPVRIKGFAGMAKNYSLFD